MLRLLLRLGLHVSGTVCSIGLRMINRQKIYWIQRKLLWQRLNVLIWQERLRHL